jgi:hypothetical protein
MHRILRIAPVLTPQHYAPRRARGDSLSFKYPNTISPLPKRAATKRLRSGVKFVTGLAILAIKLKLYSVINAG